MLIYRHNISIYLSNSSHITRIFNLLSWSFYRSSPSRLRKSLLCSYVTTTTISCIHNTKTNKRQRDKRNASSTSLSEFSPILKKATLAHRAFCFQKLSWTIASLVNLYLVCMHQYMIQPISFKYENLLSRLFIPYLNSVLLKIWDAKLWALGWRLVFLFQVNTICYF